MMVTDKLFLEHDDFPEAIIQRIQSLLTGEEAARTTILSKSWHSAWLTRPNLDLDDSRFNKRSDHFSGNAEFSEYAKKTIKRYEQSNLKIDSLKLCMKNNNFCCYTALANKLVVKALGILGATRLYLRLDSRFAFPCEVVFGAETLVELSVKGCQINLDGKVIKCRRLETLSLEGVDITRDTLCTIISSCPLIKKLSLSIQSRNEYIGECAVLGLPVPDTSYRVPAPRSAGPIIDNLDRLRCLVLCYGSFKSLFAGDLLSKLSFLTDFTLHMKDAIFAQEEDVQISNCSLERIKLELGQGWSDYGGHERRLKVRLDVPSIRKFTFEGDIIPKLSFVSSPTREWESHVFVTRKAGGFTAFWFRELNEFLTQLRQSKIHLSLHVRSIESFDYRVGDVNVIRKHELENLSIDMTYLPSYSCYALFDGLFRLCRPKLITPYWDGYSDPYYRGGTRKTNIDFLCQVLEQGMLGKVSFCRQFMYGLNDLEEVNAQVFDVPEWRPIPLNSLLDVDDDIPEQDYRFLLKWKP